MSRYQQIFDNCKPGMSVMAKGDNVAYVNPKDTSMVANYKSFGYKFLAAPADAPENIEDAGDNPLISMQLTAKEAIAMIQENDVQFLEGFITADENRKSVLSAAKEKTAEPINAID